MRAFRIAFMWGFGRPGRWRSGDHSAILIFNGKRADSSPRERELTGGLPMFEGIKRKLQLRSVEERALRSKDLGPLAQFLREQPQLSDKVARSALARNVRNANGDALLLVAALAMAGSPEAVGPLRKLVEHSRTPGVGTTWPVPWKQTTGDQARSLYLCATSSGVAGLGEDLLRCLPFPNSLDALGPFPDSGFENDPGFYLKAGHPADGLADLIVPAIEQAVLTGSVSHGTLDSATRLAELLFRNQDATTQRSGSFLLALAAAAVLGLMTRGLR